MNFLVGRENIRRFKLVIKRVAKTANPYYVAESAHTKDAGFAGQYEP